MRYIGLSGLLLSFVILAAVTSGATSPTVEPRSMAFVAQEVEAQVAATGTTRVQIVLRGGEPLPDRATRRDIDRLEARMAIVTRAAAERLEALGARVLRRARYAAGLTVEVDARVLAALRLMPDVEAIFADGPVHLHLFEGVELIGAPTFHDFGHTGAGRSVAVIDTGVDWTQPALGGCAIYGPGCRVKEAISFCPLTSDPMDLDGHGTAVAGIVAANLGEYKGVAPDADIVALKAIEISGVTPCVSWTGVEEALEWVIENHATHNIKAVNISLGDSMQHTPSDPLCQSSTIATYIDTLVTALDIPVTVSSGNDAFDGGINFPACVPEATAVGAVYDANVTASSAAAFCGDSGPMPRDRFICYTSAGPNLDLLAPSWRCDSVGFPAFEGTSAAAPYVAGGYLLMNSLAPGVDPTVIEQQMKAHGKQVPDPTTGAIYPRLDLRETSLEYDLDGDGVRGLDDNCPFVPNTQADDDGDDVGNECDICPLVPNPNQDWVGEPVVSVVHPNGGQSFKIGTTVNLQWNAFDTCGGVTSVDLLLSRNGVNGNYQLLFESLANGGSQPWTVSGPSTGGFTAFLKAVARDPGGNTGQDTSDSGFKVRCGLCQASYCAAEGVRCTANGSCGGDGCCNYTCIPHPSCTGPDECPPNACSC